MLTRRGSGFDEMHKPGPQIASAIAQTFSSVVLLGLATWTPSTLCVGLRAPAMLTLVMAKENGILVACN